LLEPLSRISYNVTRTALVIGGGVAGMMSSLALARQGIKVYLIEKANELGGLARKISKTLEGEDIKDFLNDLIHEVNENSFIEVHTETEMVNFSGYVGNFLSKIKIHKEGMIKNIEHGVTIVATGAEESKPKEYLYGEDSRVMTLLDLDEVIEKDVDRFKDCNTMVFVQCVGSRNEEHPYCSRVCCSHSIKNALKLKEVKPEMDIYILYRDMRTYGFMEDYYKKAADQGVIFIRYDVDDKPDIQTVKEGGKSLLRVSVTEPILGQRLMIDADMICLAAATVPPIENRSLSQMLKVPLNEDDFFLEAHMKLRPVDFATDGIFMCGTAHSPKFINETIAQAQAAASRAFTLLTRTAIEGEASVAEVNELLCSGCRVCELTCPYGAISLDADRGVAVVNKALCKGCGTCVGACPSGAILGKYFGTEQILAEITAALTA